MRNFDFFQKLRSISLISFRQTIYYGFVRDMMRSLQSIFIVKEKLEKNCIEKLTQLFPSVLVLDNSGLNQVIAYSILQTLGTKRK